MNLFNKLPGFVTSAPGLEHLIWRRLPVILLWGTLLPLALAGLLTSQKYRRHEVNFRNRAESDSHEARRTNRGAQHP